MQVLARNRLVSSTIKPPRKRPLIISHCIRKMSDLARRRLGGRRHSDAFVIEHRKKARPVGAKLEALALGDCLFMSVHLALPRIVVPTCPHLDGSRGELLAQEFIDHHTVQRQYY